MPTFFSFPFDTEGHPQSPFGSAFSDLQSHAGFGAGDVLSATLHSETSTHCGIMQSPTHDEEDPLTDRTPVAPNSSFIIQSDLDPFGNLPDTEQADYPNTPRHSHSDFFSQPTATPSHGFGPVGQIPTPRPSNTRDNGDSSRTSEPMIISAILNRDNEDHSQKTGTRQKRLRTSTPISTSPMQEPFPAFHSTDVSAGPQPSDRNEGPVRILGAGEGSALPQLNERGTSTNLRSSSGRKETAERLRGVHASIKKMRVQQLRHIAQVLHGLAEDMEKAPLHEVPKHCQEQVREVRRVSSLFVAQMNGLKARHDTAKRPISQDGQSSAHGFQTDERGSNSKEDRTATDRARGSDFNII